jgi:hypothetical protein
MGAVPNTEVILYMPRHSPGLGFADNGWVCASVVRPVNSDRRILTGVPSGIGETTY